MGEQKGERYSTKNNIQLIRMTSLKKSATTHDCRYGNSHSQWQPSRTSVHPAGGIKIIIQSLAMQPTTAGTTKMPFEALIQRANDSGSFDTSLEYKSLPPNRHRKVSTAAHNAKQLHNNTIHEFGYMDELRQRLNKKDGGSDPVVSPSKKIPFFDSKNVLDATPKSVRQQLMNSINVTGKRLPLCSTPFRPKRPTQLNLQTPPADARFIDSENESVDDENDTVAGIVFESDDALMDVSTTAVESTDEDEAQHRTLIKCFSLTPDSCRRLCTQNTPNRSVTSAPSSPKCERRSNFLSSFRKNRSSIVSPLEKSPLRRQKNVKIKHSKLFNFFRSTPVASKSSTECSNLSDTCTRLRQLLANAEDFDDTELGCAPLLVHENIDRHGAGKPVDWGENFEFSFICEPSHSEVDNDDYDDNDDDQKSIYVSCESVTNEQMPSIPMVKVTPAAPASSDTSHQYIRRSSIPTKNALSPFRRSISDPTLRGMVFTTVGGISNIDPHSIVAATQIQANAFRVSRAFSHRQTNKQTNK